MKNLILLILLMIPLVSMAQLTVYKTFEDFKNQEGESYAIYYGHMHIGGKYRILVKQKRTDKEIKIKCKKIWGFTYKDQLFRSTGKTGSFARLMYQGGIYYYENGVAHMDILSSDAGQGNFSIGYFAYFSEGINSELFPYTNGKLRKLTKEFPEHETLFECIKFSNKGKLFDRGNDYERIRTCLEDYGG